MRISDWSSDVCSSDLTIVTEPQSREIRSIFEIHAQSPVMARLAADARLADVARFLLDDEVYIHQSRPNHKPGFKGREFYRSEEQTSELKSLMRSSYAVFCLKKINKLKNNKLIP